MRISVHKFFLLTIILFASLLRFYNLNWDEGFHLHPDERFLTMVGNAMTWPKDIHNYFSPETSTLNPANIGYKFYVYGILPITLNKFIAIHSNTDNYNDFTIQGRFLSGFFDLFVVFLVYKIVSLITSPAKDKKSWLSLGAAFLYAIAVMPIQLSHFFTVDTFLSCFMIASFYFALSSYMTYTTYMNVILSSLFFGLALASKINAIFILPLNLVFIYLGLIGDIDKKTFIKKSIKAVVPMIFIVVLYNGISYFVLRLADPYYFQSSNFFNLQPSSLFLENLKTVAQYSDKDVFFPPAVQWVNKTPILFSLVNISVFGVGIPYFVLFVLGGIGVIWGISKGLDKKNITLVFILLWIFAFFLYQSTRFATVMRYYIFIYPFIAIFAAIGLQGIFHKLSAFTVKSLLFPVYCLLFTFILIWPLMFMSIYIKQNSRVAASEWMYKNLPDNSIIAWELWDDPLPLLVKNMYGKTMVGEQLSVFEPDTQDKFQRLEASLAKADYYSLSSNRAWGSIPTVPESFPLMSIFYTDLFDNKLDYKLIKQFSSYPSLRYLGIPIDFPDQWAEESFTVYDHPQVNIFKNTKK